MFTPHRTAGKLVLAALAVSVVACGKKEEGAKKESLNPFKHVQEQVANMREKILQSRSSDANPVKTIRSDAEWNQLGAMPEQAVVVHFDNSFKFGAADSGGSMAAFLADFAQDADTTVIMVEADKAPETVRRFQLKSLPCTIIRKANSREMETIYGNDREKIGEAIENAH